MTPPMTNDLNPAGGDAAAQCCPRCRSRDYDIGVEAGWYTAECNDCGWHGGAYRTEQAARASLVRASLPQPEGETAELVERLRAACVGHPHAKIAWPHRVLHEAADTITSLSQRLAVAEAERDAWEAACMQAREGCEQRSSVIRKLRDKLQAAEAQLAHAREAAIEECAKVADAEYNEMARLAAVHRKAGTFESMHRCNAAARSVSRVAAAIRAMKGG